MDIIFATFLFLTDTQVKYACSCAHRQTPPTAQHTHAHTDTQIQTDRQTHTHNVIYRADSTFLVNPNHELQAFSRQSRRRKQFVEVRGILGVFTHRSFVSAESQEAKKCHQQITTCSKWCVPLGEKKERKKKKRKIVLKMYPFAFMRLVCLLLMLLLLS